MLAHDAVFSLGYPQTPDIWVPLPLVADPGRNTGQLQIVARLRAGVRLDLLRHADDPQCEALKNCLRQKQANVNEIHRYAKVCRVSNVIRPYREAL